VLAAALFLAGAAASSKTPAREAVPGVAILRGDFSYSQGTCEQGVDFCAVATPREWAPPEIELVRGALDEISAHELGRQIAARASGNGFRTLRRFAHAAQRRVEGRYDVDPTIVATAHIDEDRSIRTIDLTDRFFERQAAHDHYSGEPGYLLTTEILAHELVHALDLHMQYSGTAEFRRIARIWMTGNQQREAERVNVERDRLNSEGHYEAAWQASRSFGILTMKGRLPSMQALDGYREAFAEFGAHLVLDPNARRRLEPRVILYVERAIAGTP
jgi:hypothetical protein